MTFSLMPPTFSTLPVRVSSPVMATLGSKDLFKAKLISAVAMVTPAEGPSFGTDPSGTFRWMRASSRNEFAGSSSRAKSLAYVRDTELDSLMTLPNCPVICMLPLKPPLPAPELVSEVVPSTLAASSLFAGASLHGRGNLPQAS
eukprot:CAMPEP_0172888758 /NCGR_PEP_ID=MMETSP1075-20121228/137198_1 /TAXON_ID=2916 /ORGANISM="Ceratium fusus, Strain PA161109" /LENGTH=143 /DNA_ID=CAMNT_0013742689 /DNA_START=104 /DNA_END=532 /DNA_ORIENTATION=-